MVSLTSSPPIWHFLLWLLLHHPVQRALEFSSFQKRWGMGRPKHALHKRGYPNDQYVGLKANQLHFHDQWTKIINHHTYQNGEQGRLVIPKCRWEWGMTGTLMRVQFCSPSVEDWQCFLNMNIPFALWTGNCTPRHIQGHLSQQLKMENGTLTWIHQLWYVHDWTWCSNKKEMNCNHKRWVRRC